MVFHSNIMIFEEEKNRFKGFLERTSMHMSQKKEKSLEWILCKNPEIINNNISPID